MKQRSYVQLIIVLAVIATAQPQGQRIRYALFISGRDGEIDVSGVVPAAELAEERIRADSSVLREYEFQHSPVVDTLCDRTRSLNQFFATVVESDPPVMGLIGGGCSVASEPIAEIIHNWNISQVAYDSSAIVLSDRQRFVNFFRTYPSDITFAPDVLTFLQFYGWSKIMFITEQEELFTGIYENLSRMLLQSNFTTRNRIVTRSPTTALNMDDFFFPEDDIRVIFINTYSNVARILLCEAMRTHNLVGFPRYVWITYAWYQDNWWTSAVNDEQISCDEDEIAQLLKQSIAIEVVPVPDDPEQATDVGLTTNEFNMEYLNRLKTSAAQDDNVTFTFVAPIAYDAVWSLALALNRTDTMLAWPKESVVRETNCQDDGIDLSGFRLDNFTYNHSFVGCVVRWSLAQTNFTGVSGLVSFDRDGTREQADVTLLQYRDSTSSSDSKIKRVRIGQVRGGAYVYYANESNDTVFPGGIPSDGTPINVTVTYHPALVVIYDILACLGIVLATVCLVFNFAYRNRKVVRLTSPNLNYLIIVGSIIMYTTIIIRLIPSTDETVNYVVCNLQELLTTLAYCLAFGTVLVKVGRVYHIFHNPTEKKKALLKDWHLAIGVFAITGVGVLMAVLGWAIPQLRATPTLEPDGERGVGTNEFGIRIVYLVWACSADPVSDIMTIIILIYLGLLQVIGIVLAIQTRKVKVKVLNDSKYIAALIYISSIVLIILVVISFTAVGYINVAEVFYSGGLLLATTAFLCLTFIPKMVSLYKDPLGENIFSKNNSTIEVSRSGALSIKKRGDRVLELESRVKELEGLLRESMIACGESLEVSGMDKLMIDDESHEKKESNGDATTHHLDLNEGASVQENNHCYSSTYSVTAV